jgi:ectoine hydroxylase
MRLFHTLHRYYGVFRKLKVSYILLNVLNLGKLEHARKMYRKYGVRRSVLLPISSEKLPPTTEAAPWLDQPGAAEQLPQHPHFSRFSRSTRDALLRWPMDGYVVLRGLFSPQEVASINTEVDRLISEKVVDFNFTGRKLMCAFQHSALLRQCASDRRILDVMDFLLGRPVRVFHTINFLTGSEQAAHSDSIHMTTHPLGYMIAAWIALEATTSDNGPLVYHVGSHKLPYLLNGSYDHGGGELTIGPDAYLRYEAEVQRAIDAGAFEAREFHAEPGDVLLWHANLLHGGKKMTIPNASRKSMVVHYFAENVLCYHELTQRVAMISEK